MTICDGDLLAWFHAQLASIEWGDAVVSGLTVLIPALIIWRMDRRHARRSIVAAVKGEIQGVHGKRAALLLAGTKGVPPKPEQFLPALFDFAPPNSRYDKELVPDFGRLRAKTVQAIMQFYSLVDLTHRCGTYITDLQRLALEHSADLDPKGMTQAFQIQTVSYRQFLEVVAALTPTTVEILEHELHGPIWRWRNRGKLEAALRNALQNSKVAHDRAEAALPGFPPPSEGP